MRKECYICFKSPLSKDEVGITKKLIDSDTDKFFCIDCLARFLECDIQDIFDKIEEFKEEGSTLFR